MIQRKNRQKRKFMWAAGMMMAAVLAFSGCGDKKAEEPSKNAETELAGEAVVKNNVLDAQKKIDENLQKEAEQGYTIENPLVVADPYGNSPLTAAVIFQTEEETAVTITVKGKDEKGDITQTFEKGTNHVLPVYGLYEEYENDVVIRTEDGKEKNVKIQTEALEMDLGKVKTEIKDKEAFDYGKLTFSFNGKNIFALDHKGEVRWYRQGVGFPFKRLANGHVIYGAPKRLSGIYYQSGLVETDMMGKVYAEYIIPGGQHHDVFEMPNGNLLVAGSAQDFSTVEDHIVELDRKTGEVVYELDMKDLIDPKDGGSINQTEEDWFHNNAVWYDEATDTILLSARHVDAIVGVNKTEKKLAWILGDPTDWTGVDKSLFFTPAGDNFEWQYAQHQVSMRPDGSIMMFDNGAGRTKKSKIDQKVEGDDVYSRAVAFKIDTEAMTVEQVFEYGREMGRDGYSEWISGAECVDGDTDHVVVTSGAHLRNPETGNCDYGPDDMFNPELEKSTIVTEVKDGKVIAQTTTGVLTYRSSRLPMYWDNKGMDLETEGVYLGSLGETKEAEAVDTEKLTKEKMNPEWMITYDSVCLALTGSYEIAKDEKAADAYFLLENGEEKHFYKMQQGVTPDKENGTQIVALNGWISPAELEGKSFTISVVIKDKLYETGKKITF